jgi:arylsulfatase A-like enzyme
VRWPKAVPPGRTSAQLAMTMDWVPTFLEAAGVAPHADYPLDGITLMENLRDPVSLKSRDLFWRMKFRDQKAVRSGAWKWLSIEGREYLFDLSRDARERANRAKREPKLFHELKGKYAAWEASVPPIPADAKFSLVYGAAEIPAPS